MSMQLVLMNCLKEKKYGDALSACNALLARFPTDAMALECNGGAAGCIIASSANSAFAA